MIPAVIGLRETSFADSTHPNNNTIESQISLILWRWKFADLHARDDLIAESRMAMLIEFWFPFTEIEYTMRRGTWCDGIPLFHITEIDRTTFQIAGVGYFPHQLAPFELDFHFLHRRDATPQAIILRLGHILRERDQSCVRNKHPQLIFDSRPRSNSDWAVAVELTEDDHENAS